MSDALAARRLRYVCDNTEALREALAAMGETDLLNAIASSDRPQAALTRLAELLDLHHHSAWNEDTRRPAGDFAGLSPAAPVVRLVCPHTRDCGRSAVWMRDDPPRCALIGRDLRWDGDERLSQ